MMIKKFSAPTTREALKLVRDAMGPDALILSNRAVQGQVEIMAMAENDLAAISQNVPPSSAARPMRHQIPGLETIERTSFHVTDEDADAASLPTSYAPAAHTMPPRMPHAESKPKPAPKAQSPQETASAPAPETGPVVAQLADEVKNIRNLIERQLVNLAWREMKSTDPQKFDVLRILLSQGFSPKLAREFSGGLPPGLDQPKTLRWLRSAIAHNLRCTDGDIDLIEQGGIYALVGPTGVGKTTTVAKLAARCVIKYGAENLALITSDTYRIGAYEQLKIYGKILNVPVYAAKHETELAQLLHDLQDKHLVLIDTVGMSQRDRRVAQQLALLSGKIMPIRRLLLLSATAQAGTLDDVVRAYQGDNLAGTILTKIDETMNLAPVLDVCLRHRMKIHYVTNGQRVPEDLHRANSLYLVDRALKHETEAAHMPRDEEYPIMMSGRPDEAHAFLNTSQSV